MNTGITTAHSVVEPTPRTKRIAGTLIILYALITMVPLVWIIATSIKSPPEFDQLSPEDPVPADGRGLLQLIHRAIAPDSGIHGATAASVRRLRKNCAIA